MRTISQRQFRVEFPTLTEPVFVVRREQDGNFTMLGTWTPQDDAKQLTPRAVQFLDEHFGESRPAPKGKR